MVNENGPEWNMCLLDSKIAIGILCDFHTSGIKTPTFYAPLKIAFGSREEVLNRIFFSQIGKNSVHSRMHFMDVSVPNKHANKHIIFVQ